MSVYALLASLSWKLAHLLLRLSSYAVPARRRKDWLGEWIGELWQVHNAAGRQGHCSSSLRFVAGALPDAIGLQVEGREEPCLEAVPASRYLRVLACLAVLTTAVAFSLPKVRAEFRQMNWRTPKDLSILFLPNGNNEAVGTITPERFALWKGRAPYLKAIGFYQVEDREVTMKSVSTHLRIAHGTQNLASMVGESSSFENREDATPGGLILSRRTWRQKFHSEPSMQGMLVGLNGKTVPIASVADIEDAALPGAYDAWLFDDQPFKPGTPGFVLARFMAGTETNPYFGFDHFSVGETRDSEISGLAFAVSERKVNPWYTLALGFAFSLFALPATTPLGFGQRVRTEGHPSAWQVAWRWVFMLLKFLIWAEIASSTALIAASIFSREDWRLAVGTRVLVAFTVSLLGLRWSILDQRRRCPACLNRLTNPARVGEPSRSFLSWNGTELVCQNGHGVMHVPAHATSWFSAQRWLALDSSWQFLFAHRR